MGLNCRYLGSMYFARLKEDNIRTLEFTVLKSSWHGWLFHAVKICFRVSTIGTSECFAAYLAENRSLDEVDGKKPVV